MTVGITQNEINKWHKAQQGGTALPQSTINEDGTKDLVFITILSEAYPQQNRTGWRCSPVDQPEVKTFFNIYPEDYHRIPSINEARETGERIPATINKMGRAVMFRLEDIDPTQPKAIERAKQLADGVIDKYGNKVKPEPRS